MMENILVTGSNGQLGCEIRKLSSQLDAFCFYFTDMEDLDICDAKAVDDYVNKNKISAIINCAAYTAVDKAEEAKDLCFAVNKWGARNLALASKKYKAFLLHVSTDYVFSGDSFVPYSEEMLTSPRSVYGQSKKEGEDEVIQNAFAACIVRTSWLYSSFGNNFVKTMMRLGKEKSTLNIVFDQVGTPTYAFDLAEALLIMCQHYYQRSNRDLYEKVEIYHFSNEGVLSWYDFAKEIMDVCGYKCEVFPIESKEYPMLAPRPHYSVLNKNKIKRVYGLHIPYWKNGLYRMIQELKS